MSRLSMSHFAENSYRNDIVGELGITGVGFGGAAGYGAPYFTVQGYSPFGDSWLATPMQAWDTVVEARNTLSWQKGAHSLKFGQCPEDLKDEGAGCGGGVNILRQAFEGNALLFELRDGLDEVFEGTA